MSCHYPTVRMPGCPVEFDEDDYSWTAEESEAFILDREDELEILLPFIEYDGDLINMLWEKVKDYDDSFAKAMNRYVENHLNEFKCWRGDK